MKPDDFAKWPRPLMASTCVALIPVAVLTPVGADKLALLLWFAGALFFFRGAVDKDGLARLLSIWRGRDDREL